MGFEEFAEYVKSFTPEYVSGITGIDEDRIEDLAESIVDAEGASYVMYTGLEYTKSGVQNIRAVMVLWALAGQLDVEGGRCFARRENRINLCKNRQIETPGFEKSIANGKFPVYSLYCGGEPHASLLPKSIIDGDPYKIRALLIYGASLITSWPNPGLWRKALQELDFLVTIDLQLTADAAYADIVLRTGILLLLWMLLTVKRKDDRAGRGRKIRVSNNDGTGRSAWIRPFVSPKSERTA